MTTSQNDDKRPTPDPAEDNAFFPSPYSLSQFTSTKSDLSGADYPSPYKGGRWKILLIGADERYLLTNNGTMFSTGNHPVETLLPMYHLDKAGFTFDIATLSGNPVKFEFWAMPSEDPEIQGLYAQYRDRFKSPLKLTDVIDKALGEDSDYIGVFIPGGHGALIGLPESHEVKKVLQWPRTNSSSPCAMAPRHFWQPAWVSPQVPTPSTAIASAHFPMPSTRRRPTSATCRGT
jgi:molecular chaperone Hsp31 and glyoxalase 3